ncbi:hypothetical protein HYU18_00535 [Candidatus Woesearchaeota archaeon]|nr:hypothetical protein [Candidatus Woesearchaeota archaeon]
MIAGKKRRMPKIGLSKKAVAIDVDWIISLGLFLIYLGAFFVFIRQLPGQDSPADSLLDNVHDGIVDRASWNVQRVPLFINSNISGKEPMIINFPYDWKNFTFEDNHSFDIKDSKLVFPRQLIQGKNVLEIASSGENYTLPSEDFDLEASPSAASIDSQRFNAEFSNAFLSRASHFDKERLDEFNISISGIVLKPETASTEANISALSAKYKLVYPQANHTAFVVAGFSRILNYVGTDAKESHDIVVSATVRNYTFFHVTNALSGTINYTAGGCTSGSSRYIDFNDGVSGVTFVTPEGSNFSFCIGNSTVRMGIQFALQNESRYDIIFHPGDHNATTRYVSPYRTAFGAIENLTGVSTPLYRKLNETAYDTLKSAFRYPSSRDFSFTLLNDTGGTVFNYQPQLAGATNVFAKESEVFILDKYGIKSRHRLRIRGW